MTLLSLPIEGRLLSAINHAYHLAIPGGVPQRTHKADYVAAVGYMAEPVSIAHPAAGDALAVIGTTEAGVLLSFRCPLLEEPAEFEAMWGSIAQITGGKLNQPRIKNWPKGAKVQQDSWKLLTSIWDKVRAAVKAQVSAGEEALPLHITGHNAGGVLATLAAMRLHVQDDIKATKVVTFGSQKPGDKTFATAYNKALKSQHTRFESALDLLPMLPATRMVARVLSEHPGIDMEGSILQDPNYEAVGTLKFIRTDGQLRTGSKAPAEKSRAKAILAHLTALLENGDDISGMMDAHRPGCGHPYLTEVAPEICEPIVEDQTASDSDAHTHSEEDTASSDTHTESNENTDTGDGEPDMEDWEKELMNNPGCTPFSWFFGGSRR